MRINSFSVIFLLGSFFLRIVFFRQFFFHGGYGMLLRMRILLTNFYHRQSFLLRLPRCCSSNSTPLSRSMPNTRLGYTQGAAMSPLVNCLLSSVRNSIMIPLIYLVLFIFYNHLCYNSIRRVHFYKINANG